MEQKRYHTYFNSLKMLFLPLFIGQIVFALVAVTLNEGDKFYKQFEMPQEIQYVALVGLLIGLSSRFMHIKLLKDAAKTDGVVNKLQKYRSAFIVAWALMEGGSFMATGVYLVTGELYLLAVPAILVAYLFTIRPDPIKFAKQMSLTRAEVDEMKRNW